jgi:predicted ArsR family transcriptional regulator
VAFLEERAPDLLDEYLDTGVGRWEAKIPVEAGDQGRELPDRVSRLARWLDDEGFMPSVRVARGNAGFDLTLNNCPVLCLAMGTKKVCDRTEVGLRLVFSDCEITRSEWRGSGDRCCTYHFEARPAK